MYNYYRDYCFINFLFVFIVRILNRGNENSFLKYIIIRVKWGEIFLINKMKDNNILD